MIRKLILNWLHGSNNIKGIQGPPGPTGIMGKDGKTCLTPKEFINEINNEIKYIDKELDLFTAEHIFGNDITENIKHIKLVNRKYELETSLNYWTYIKDEVEPLFDENKPL